MKKTKIEWCDSTWNPVTGCFHGCEYCYARRFAKRFGKRVPDGVPDFEDYSSRIHLLRDKKKGNPYPYLFDPTLHEYRLNEPAYKTKPQTIFVCSMADLFGDWVPDEWIEEVFAACKKAPQHRYLFLTKNPQRYIVLASVGLLPDGDNFWYGSSTPSRDDIGFCTLKYNTFLSVEPILSEFERKPEGVPSGYADWVVLGAMTGPGSRNHVPKLETIENIIASVDVPVFMKDSLIPIVGEDNMRRELPWDA